MAADRHSMSAVDAAWMRMDRPTSLMMIVGVLVFERPPGFRRFRKLIAERFLRFERFRCRPADDLVSASWELDPHFDLDAHVRRVALPLPAGRRQLEALVANLAGSELDRRRPLWQFQYVDNYAGGAAIIVRIHHCYADGIALARVFMSLTDEPAIETGAAGPRASGQGLFEGLLADGAGLLGRIGETVLHPQSANELAARVLSAALELARVAVLPDDPPTSLKGPLGTRKAVAWAEPLPLAEVRTVARALGCTVNDVAMGAAAGALGGYLRARGEDTHGLTLRAAVPFNLRDPADAPALGNRFGLVFLDLPVGIRDPLERVQAVHTSMAKLKRSPQPTVMLGLMTALGLLGAAAQNAAVDLLSRKATLVATNVPGPAGPLRLAGQRVSQVVFWVPQSGDLGLGLSVLSHAGQLQFGVLADRRRIANPRDLVTRFTTEFEATLLAVLLGPFVSRSG